MTVSVDIDKAKDITEARVKRAKKRMGKLLRRMRTNKIRNDGQKMSLRDVANKAGISAVTVSNAESGNLSLTTFILLYEFYRDQTDLFNFVELLESEVDGNYIPIDTLRSFANSEPLTTNEFMHVVAHFPSSSYRVSYNTHLDLKALGFAVCCVVSEGENHYYGATIETAQADDSDKQWRLPTQVTDVPLAEASTQSREFTAWAQQVLLAAVKDRPEYAEYVNINKPL